MNYYHNLVQKDSFGTKNSANNQNPQTQRNSIDSSINNFNDKKNKAEDNLSVSMNNSTFNTIKNSLNTSNVFDKKSDRG